MMSLQVLTILPAALVAVAAFALSAVSVAGVRKRRAPGGVEQRAHHRAELQVEVTFSSDSHFFVGLTNDISTGGVFVSTYRPLEIGQQVQLDFALPEGTIQVKGTVRWRRDS